MIIGHEALLKDLEQRAQRGQLHHAQLFIGPKQVGKTSIALHLAAALQDVLDKLPEKKQLFEGKDADTLLFLDEGEGLSIKEVRMITERCSQGHDRPYLVVIIENIGRMKAEAMNALLKTLEEPGEGTVFFLTANEEEDVLPTIRSRCNVSFFHGVADELLATACEEHVYKDRLLMFAMGRPGKLFRLMEDADYFEAHERMHDSLTRFLEGPDTHSAFSLSRDYEKSDLTDELLDILLHRSRTLALSGKLNPYLKHLDLTDRMEHIEDTKHAMKQNVNKKLLLENLFLPFVP